MRQRRAARPWAKILGATLLSTAPLSAVRPGLAAEMGHTNASIARAVTVVRVDRTCFTETLQVTGTVSPRTEILVRPDKEGQLSQVLVEAGESVRSGQVLARLKQPGPQGTDVSLDVTAPADGLVYAAFGAIGAPVSPGSEPLFRIVQRGELELVGDVPVASMARLAVQQSVKVAIIGVGDVGGRVRLISRVVNPTTQLGQVRILLGTDGRIRVGAFGRGTIQLAQRCGPALPLSAVLYGRDGAIVQVVRNDRVETRAVKVGQIEGGEAEIRIGLSGGETVVSRAGSFVRDGDPVLPVESPPGR